MNEDLNYMQQLSYFSKYESQKYERIVNWVITNNLHGEDGYFNLLLKEAFVNLI